MAAEVFRPHEVVAGRFGIHPTAFHRRRVMPATGNSNNLVVSRKQHRKTSPPKPDKRIHNAAAAAPEARKSSRRHGGASQSRHRFEAPTDALPATGKVTILRRGESRSSITPPIAGGNPRSPFRNPVEDPSVRKQIRLPPAEIYAGSAFSLSPSPSSVPLPSFFNRKDSYDGASRDLRRLLRLE